MKILITGIDGQVGHALTQYLKSHELIRLNRQDCDLTMPDQIKLSIDRHRPDLIINPAAFTQVEKAENEFKLAFQINRDAPRVMAEKAREYNIPFIHFSTDYVFDGSKEGSYIEDDPTCPLGIYGQSKLEGEEAVQSVGGQFYIFRTSWVYSNIGHNFYLTIKKLSQERDELKVVDDNIGTPTSNIFIAEKIQKIIPQLNSNNSGIYHLVPNGSCSWYNFAKQIIRKTNLNFNLENLYPIQMNEYPSQAQRPQNSCLSNQKSQQTFMLKFEDWQTLFRRVTDEA